MTGIFVALVGWPVLAMVGFSRVRTGFRAAMTQVHDMAGIFTGWLIYVITLSGTLSVFRPEISLWARPELGVRPVDPVKATEAAIGWLSRHAPQSSAWYITPARERAPFSWAAWDQNGAFLQRALDPVTGSPDTIRDTLGGDFFYRFHFELQLPYALGASACRDCSPCTGVRAADRNCCAQADLSGFLYLQTQKRTAQLAGRA
nr:PepSY-associated TM helix domain-containing protein [Acetobacter cerevisiae]